MVAPSAQGGRHGVSAHFPGSLGYKLGYRCARCIRMQSDSGLNKTEALFSRLYIGRGLSRAGVAESSLRLFSSSQQEGQGRERVRPHVEAALMTSSHILCPTTSSGCIASGGLGGEGKD